MWGGATLRNSMRERLIETFLQNHIPASKLKLLDEFLDSADPEIGTPGVWRFIYSHILSPEYPLEIHQQLLKATYAEWPIHQNGPYQVSCDVGG